MDASVALRGRGQGDRADASDLRGHDVHHDTRRVDGLAARHVDPDAADGSPPLRDARPGSDDRLDARRDLRRGCLAHALDRPLEGCPHRGIERLECCGNRLGCHPDVVRAHAVEAFGLLAKRRFAPVSDVGDEIAGSIEGVLAGRFGTRHGRRRLARGQAAKIDRAHHF